MKRLASVILCWGLIASLACSGPGPNTSPICTADFRAGLLVYVKDSVTNAGVASGASLVVRASGFKDSVAAPRDRPEVDGFPLQAAHERAGTYQVEVSKPGYATWSLNNVQVTRNECHVNTVSLTALLQPAT